MPEFSNSWTDEQIAEINARAVRIFQEITEGKELPQIVLANVYQGVLNMAGQVELTPLVRGTQLPTMAIPGEKR